MNDFKFEIFFNRKNSTALQFHEHVLIIGMIETAMAVVATGKSHKNHFKKITWRIFRFVGKSIENNTTTILVDLTS